MGGGSENTRMTAAIQKEHHGEEQNEDKWPRPELCIYGCILVPCAVCPGMD